MSGFGLCAIVMVCLVLSIQMPAEENKTINKHTYSRDHIKALDYFMIRKIYIEPAKYKEYSLSDLIPSKIPKDIFPRFILCLDREVLVPVMHIDDLFYSIRDQFFVLPFLQVSDHRLQTSFLIGYLT